MSTRSGILRENENNISDRIEELKKVALKDNSEEKKKRIENIDRLEKDKSELSAQLKTEELYFNQLKASITHKKEKIYSIRKNRDLKMTIDQKRRTLLNLEGSQSNELKRYGEYMPELLQKIDEAHMKRKFVSQAHWPNCEIKEELKGLQSKCQDVNAQLKTVSNECRNNENEYNKVMKVIEKNNQAVGQISMEISGLQSIEDPEPVDITVLVSLYLDIILHKT
ncbi:Structural maintenance of chromosomes protein 6 [Nymphon striatum]|nr:Structural maintenance of chromosomes protein 6 [Nymphon striatum]